MTGLEQSLLLYSASFTPSADLETDTTIHILGKSKPLPDKCMRVTHEMLTCTALELFQFNIAWLHWLIANLIECSMTHKIVI